MNKSFKPDKAVVPVHSVRHMGKRENSEFHIFYIRKPKI